MKMNRRELLKTSLLAGAAATLRGTGIARGAALPTASVGVRRNIMSLSAAGPELATLSKVVAAMQGLSATDCRTWRALAEVHETHCPHGNWFFFPWHRAYLASFEQLCQSVGGDASFRLPYWDWLSDRRIPAPFWGHPLDDSSRRVTSSTPIPAGRVEAQAVATFLATPDFVTACGAPATHQRHATGGAGLEMGPHNDIHTWIRGNMVTMLSPLDPVFWLHHANIDRLWSEWLRTHGNPTDPAWLAYTFTDNFVDPACVPQSPVVGDLLDTHALGYRYQDEPETSHPTPQASQRSMTLGTSVFARTAPSNQPVQTTIEGRIPDDVIESLRAQAPALQETIRIEIDGLQPVRGARIRVFVNHPNLTADTSVEDPHYVGAISFFAHAEHREPVNVVMNAAPAIQRLARLGRPEASAPIQVQLIAVSENAGLAESEGLDRLSPKRLEVTLIRSGGVG